MEEDIPRNGGTLVTAGMIPDGISVYRWNDKLYEKIEKVPVKKSGPWDDEWDKYVWWDGDYWNQVQRMPSTHHLCGYVAVNPDHQLYDIDYNQCMYHGCNYQFCDHTPANLLDVHGGITYSEYTTFDEEEEYWKYVNPRFTPEDFFIFGFDAAHLNDVVPGMKNHRGTYKDFEYMRSECESLTEQLREYE